MDYEAEIKKLKADLDALNQEVYRNNFSSHQDFNKTANFTTRLKVPSYTEKPLVCEKSEIIESNGVLYICSSTNTWTVVGTQT